MLCACLQQLWQVNVSADTPVCALQCMGIRTQVCSFPVSTEASTLKTRFVGANIALHTSD